MINKQNDIKINLNVRWTPEQDGAFLVIPTEKLSLRLAMQDAIVWDLLIRFKETKTVIKLMGAIFQIELAEAQSLVQKYLDDWKKQGLLV